jgi:dynein light chain LC8-type
MRTIVDAFSPVLLLVPAEDLSEEALVFVKQASQDAFGLQPVTGRVYQTIASTIRQACDKELGRGWNCVVGRSFGAFVTQKIKCYAYLSVFPGVSILLWKT